MFEVISLGRKRVVDPKVTVRSTGFVSFNTAVMEKAKKFVEIYIDSQANKLGFKFLDKQTDNSKKVGKNGFSAKSGLHQIIDFSQSKRYPLSEEKGMWITNLDEGEVIKRSLK